LATFYTVENGHDFRVPACAANDNFYICWPTTAPSSLDFYAARNGGIPGWKDSLLVTSLKEGTLFRLVLNAAGDGVSGEAIRLFKHTDRYRDLTVSPDGRTIYIVTDSGGSTQAPGGGATSDLEHIGAILEYHYSP
jgi:hypothetical protein